MIEDRYLLLARFAQAVMKGLLEATRVGDGANCFFAWRTRARLSSRVTLDHRVGSGGENAPGYA
jgi:hypothetical protein